MHIENHQASSGGQKKIENGERNMKNIRSKEARDAWPLGNEYTSGPMQKGSSLTDGRRRLAMAGSKTKVSACSTFYGLQFLTFDDRHNEDVDDKSREEIDFHLVQIFIVEHVSERQQPGEPNDSMARPFEELAVSLEASDLHKVQQEGNELLRQLHIALQNVFEKVWNDALVSLEPRVGINLKINQNECVKILILDSRNS